MPAKSPSRQPDLSKNIEFLFNSYSNTRQMIQFFDTKAGAYVTVAGILASLITNNIVKVLTELPNKHLDYWQYILISFVSILAVCFFYNFTIIIYQAFLVLYPRSGQMLVKEEKALGLFWAGEIMQYLQKNTTAKYTELILKMEQQDIVVELSYEARKLSKITSIKLEHLGKATSHSKWMILFWVFLLIITSVLEILLPRIP